MKKLYHNHVIRGKYTSINLSLSDIKRDKKYIIHQYSNLNKHIHELSPNEKPSLY